MEKDVHPSRKSSLEVAVTHPSLSSGGRGG